MLSIISQTQDGMISPQENGFKHQADTILQDLNMMRRSTPFINMSLGEYLPYWEYENKKVNSLNFNQEHKRDLVRDFFLSLGILNIGEVTVKNLAVKRNDGARFLFPELVRSAVEIGLSTGPIYPNIVAEVQRTSGERTAVMPTVHINQNYPERLGEDETMPEATVTYGSRNVNIYAKGLGIKFTYDALSGMKIKLLQMFLQSQGKLVGLACDADALNVLISGDQQNGSQEAAVIGLSDHTKGVQYSDLIRVYTWMSGQGHVADTMIVGFDAAMDMFNMDEFKLKNQSGTSLIKAKSNIPLPTDLSIYAKSNMPEKKILILDSKSALVEFEGEPLLVETDKLIFERIEGTAVSMRVGFANLYRTGRVVLDLDHDYSDEGYSFEDYAWFGPLDSIPLASA